MPDSGAQKQRGALLLEDLTKAEQALAVFYQAVQEHVCQKNNLPLNYTQVLICARLDEECTVGQVTAKGSYNGSNVSYNLKPLVEGGYVASSPELHDKRSTRLKRTESGDDVRAKFNAAVEGGFIPSPIPQK